jgi:multiple sugar transport system permease protein
VTRVAAGLVVLWSLGPFLWFSLASIKGPAEVARRPPTVIPERPTLEGYRLSAEEGLFRWMRNSAVVAGATTILGIPLAAMAAYALSRTRLRGRRAILGLLLGVSMFPQVTLAPVLYRMLDRMGLVNTLAGPVVPYVTLSLPLSIWLLASFFREIPQELEEAARLDGAGPIRTLFRVFLPVAAPGLATASLLVFIQAWNEFFFALILLTRTELKTLPVGIATMPGQYTFPWGEVAAASVVATAPLLAAALLFQKRILSGLTAGAVKG